MCNYTYNMKEQEKYEEAIEALKEEARDMLMAKTTPKPIDTN